MARQNVSTLSTIGLKIPKGGNQKPYIEGQTMQSLKGKGETMIYKTLHRKLKIEHYLCGTFSIYITVADLEGGAHFFMNG